METGQLPVIRQQEGIPPPWVAELRASTTQPPGCSAASLTLTGAALFPYHLLLLALQTELFSLALHFFKSFSSL